MSIAKKQDWRTEPLPDRHAVIELQLHYSQDDRQKIVKGLIPEQMEDKWFIYFDDGILHFHRSWTGFCVYRVHVLDAHGRFIFTHAEVNRDSEQYKETDDNIDRQMILFLTSTLLLGKPATFPISKKPAEDVLKVWSSVGEASHLAQIKTVPASDLVRIMPEHRYAGIPTLAHRPYAFYADAESLKGKTVAECFSLVHGLNLPAMESGTKHCSPFIGNRDLLPEENLEDINYVMLRVSRKKAIQDLDVFPATWRALAYIVSDPQRMGAQPLSWKMNYREFASARIHALFKESCEWNGDNLLASRESKDSLGLNDLESLRSKEDEFNYYSYISRDPALMYDIEELFGINCRCWHGCGYLGPLGKPICHFFWLRNIMTSDVSIEVMNGRDIFPEKKRRRLKTTPEGRRGLHDQNGHC